MNETATTEAQMTHPLVTQLRFTRSEFIRCVEGVTAEEAIVHIEQPQLDCWSYGEPGTSSMGD
jgi:hypothetical protein